MKKTVILGAVLIALATARPLHAQETIKETGQEVKEAGKSAGKAVKEGGKKVGRKTSEVASKGKSRVTDTEHKDKVGPNGENIFIDNHSRYYWVDKQGRRHYVLESELKDKSQ